MLDVVTTGLFALGIGIVIVSALCALYAGVEVTRLAVYALRKTW